MTSDVVLTWPDPALKTSAPDVAMIEGLADPEAPEGAIDLKAEGASVPFALEVVSTSSAKHKKKDTTDNVEIYAQAGVKEYILVYPRKRSKKRRKKTPPRLEGRRLGAEGSYELVPSDARGRWASQELGLDFSIDPTSDRVVAEISATGERLLSSDELEAKHKEEQAKRKEEQAKRKEAERRALGEAAAREEAERRAEELAEELARLRRRLGDD